MEKKNKKRANTIKAVIPLHLFALSILVLGLLGSASIALAEDEIDLTGETCLSGTAIIDPDGEGPLPAYTYCVMEGVLPENHALEMDDIGNDDPVPGIPDTAADANLFASADSSNDPDLPAVGGATYIDWNDLDITPLIGIDAAPFGSVENHRILDWTANSDFTMFRPQANSCLNDGSVLPKEDFTQSYIGNNNEYLYFAQERRTNNGNSVYYWLLTTEPPIVFEGGDCGSNTRGQIQFNLSDGDVEILVNFPDSNDPAAGGIFFRSYSGAESGYIPARDAVFHPQWGAQAPVVNFALNIVSDGDDDFGYWGGINKKGDPVSAGSYEQAMLAEWAISLSDLFDTPAVCGQELFITAVSRSSTGQIGDLTEPSALKDIIGPKFYSFGDVEAEATLTGTCSLEVNYSGTAESPSGPLTDANATFYWEFYKCVGTCDTDNPPGDDTSAGSVADNDSGTFDVSSYGAGQYYAILTVTEDATDCTDTVTSNIADVYGPISADIQPDAESLVCPGDEAFMDTIQYTALPTGGNGDYTYTWFVGGDNIGAPCGDSASCIVDFADGDFCASITAQVQVGDSSGICEPASSEEETVTKVTMISATDSD